MIYESVKLQQAKFGLLYTGKPRHLSNEEKQFYITALKEEIQEYEEAKLLEDELDAILDILVFAVGAMLRHGFPEKAITEVVKANLKKEIGTNEKRNDFQLDLIKPLGWEPPNLARFLV